MDKFFVASLTIINLLIIIYGIDEILKKVSKNANEFKGYALPIYIILGSIFHVLHLLVVFNIVFFIASLFLIVKKIFFIPRKLDVLLAIIITYFTFQDAVNHITWNHPDAGSNFSWQKSILSDYVYNYPIGFSILTSSVKQLINFERSINYVAASIALIIAFEVYKINSNSLGKKMSIFFQFIILLPISSTILFTRIGFNTGQILFLLFILILNLIYNFTYNSKYKINLIQIIIISVASILTAPHVFITWSIALFFVSLFLFVFIKKYIFILYLSCLMSIFILIYLIIFSKINSFSKFSELIFNKSSELENNMQNKSEINSVVEIFLNFIQVKSYIRPPLDNILFFASYIAIFIMIISFLFSKNLTIKSISILGIILGFITQTGIFELSYFKGRSGIYFYYTFIFVLLMFYKKLGKSKLKKTFLIDNYLIIIISTLYLLFIPNKAYRETDETVYLKTKNILDEYKQNINIMSDFKNMRLIDSRIIEYELKFDKTLLLKMDYVILNTSNKRPDPYLSGLKKYEDRDISEFYKKMDIITQDRIKRNLTLSSLILNNDFQLVVRNKNYVILKNRFK